MRVLRTLSCAIFLTLGVVSYSLAQTRPITNCAEFVGKWHNQYDILVDLTIHDPLCNYSVYARGGSDALRLVFGDPKRTQGIGYYDVTRSLVLLLVANNPKEGYFRLKRQGRDVAGSVTIPGILFGGTYPITLESRKEFPIDNATR